MPDLRHAISIGAPPAEVFAAVSTRQGFTRWWTSNVEVQEGEGDGVYVFGFDEDTVHARFRVDERSPPQRLVLGCLGGIEDWKGTTLVFELEPLENGTFLRFDHAGWTTEDWYFRQCNSTWGHLMYHLKRACEEGVEAPFFSG